MSFVADLAGNLIGLFILEIDDRRRGQRVSAEQSTAFQGLQWAPTGSVFFGGVAGLQ